MGLKLHQISLGSVKPGLGLVASPDPPTDDRSVWATETGYNIAGNDATLLYNL